MNHSIAIYFKLLVVVMLSSLIMGEAYGVPAPRHNITVEQADGSTLQIRVHGDEFFRWRSTTDGQPISDRDGYYYFARYNQAGEVELSEQRVKRDGRMQSPPRDYIQSSAAVSAIGKSARVRKVEEMSSSTISRVSGVSQSSSSSSTVNGIPSTLLTSSFPTSGEGVKTIILLLEFTDKKFSLLNANSNFTSQLNNVGYTSSHGAVGSARDYFLANSGSSLDLQFDVYGPYTLPNNMAYYGTNGSDGFDSNPQQMVTDGADLALADGVDFSQYDLTSDGIVDNIFVYYAGYNEAEGASSNTIWPHKWAVYSTTLYSGKRLYVYACTSELRGVKGTLMAGIGTFCHEFSHVFGLYDHYDTDGDTSGESIGLYTFDLMSYGSYNNNGNSPPLYTALERMMVEWGTPQYYGAQSSVTQESILNGEFYRIDTDVEHEFYLVENRQKDSSIWEEYLDDDGLLITHVDMSSSYQSKWLANGPNNDTSHECYRIIAANNADLNSSLDVWGNACYPLYNSTSWNSSSTPRAQSWSGVELDYGLSSITTSGSNITYNVDSSESIEYYYTSWQRDALIGWYDDSYDSYRVDITSSSNEMVGEWFSSESYLTVDGLAASTIYSFSIYGINSEGTAIALSGGKFSTLPQNSTIPTVALSKYEYSLGDKIYLKAINLEDGDSAEWYFDGVSTSEGYYTLSQGGEHTIKAVVTRGSDSYMVIKEISVL